MTRMLNPFPDYPVINLDDNVSDIVKSTLKTPAIQRASELIEEFLIGWSERSSGQQAPTRLVMAVRGDYGSGKTHLLLYVAGLIRRGFAHINDKSSHLSLLVPCIQSEPLSWYRSIIAPALDFSVLERAILETYALAGMKVAEQTKLTKSAIEALRKNPEKIFSLIQQDLLNESAVDVEFSKLLDARCPESSAEIKQIMRALFIPETSSLAKNWLGAQSITPRQQDTLGVTSSIENEADVTQVLVATAGLLSGTNRPFVLMIDELEHFIAWDNLKGSKQNIIWLKRLLESLARYSALVVVSGHWSAWEATSDYLERFTPNSKIDIHKLNGGDVKKIVEARVPTIKLPINVAESIASVSAGNIRRVLSLLRVLFDKRPGFVERLDDDFVREVANQISQKVTPEEAVLKIHEIFEQKGYSIKRPFALKSGIQFPLAIVSRDKPRIAVTTKHSVTQKTLINHLNRFLNQINEARQEYPNLLGYFISEGADDPALRSILDSDQAKFISFFDLTTPSGLRELEDQARKFTRGEGQFDVLGDKLQSLLERENALAQQLKLAQASRDEEVTKKLGEQRDDLNRQLVETREAERNRTAQLEVQIERLEQKRSQEFADLQHRLAKLAQQLESTREASLTTLQPDEGGTRLQTVFSELMQPPERTAGLSALLSTKTLIGLVLGLVTIIFGMLFPSIGDVLEFPMNYKLTQFMSFGLGIYLLLISFFFWFRHWQYIGRVMKLRKETLRKIYLRTESAEHLLEIDSIFNHCLERQLSTDEIRRVVQKYIEKIEY